MLWPTDNAGIILLILSHEGGYVDRPNDRGGPTNFGITIDTLSSWRSQKCTATDVKNLSVQEASDIYKAKYIVAPGFGYIADIKLRTALADFGVLFGPVTATLSLQQILGVKVDGDLGSKSLAAANGRTDIQHVINQLSGDRIVRHAKFVGRHPEEVEFLLGWVNRALTFIE